MEHRQEYPKKIYHRDGRRRRVLSIGEHELYPASEGWAESPAGPFVTLEAPEMASVAEEPVVLSHTEEDEHPKHRRRRRHI